MVRHLLSAALVIVMVSASFAFIASNPLPVAEGKITSPDTLYEAVYEGSAVFVETGEDRVFVFGGIDYSGYGTNIIQVYDPDTGDCSIASSQLPNLVRTSAVELGNSVYIFGGYIASPSVPGFSSTIYEFDLEDYSLTPVGNLPVGLQQTCAVAIDGYAYIFGGLDEFYNPSSTIYRFNPATNTATSAGMPSMPFSRMMASATYTGTNAYILGGFDSGAVPTDTIFRFNPYEGICEELTDVRLPLANARAGAATLDGCVYVYGGENLGGASIPFIMKFDPRSHASCFDFDELSHSLEGISVVAGNNIAYILGGYASGSGLLASIQLHEPTSFHDYEALYASGYLPGNGFAYPSVADVNGKVYVLGGKNTLGFTTQEVRLYNPDNERFVWRANLDIDVYGAACAELDGLVYVFGGVSGSRDPDSCIQTYDPRLNTCSYAWDLQFGLKYMDAVAYNGYLFLFGGYNEFGYTSDEIIRYNPNTHIFDTVGTLPYPVCRYSLARDGDTVYLVGGMNEVETSLDDVIEIPLSTMSGVAHYGVLPTPVRDAVAGFTDDGYMHLIGGYSDYFPWDIKAGYLIDVKDWRYDVSSVALPIPLQGAKMVQEYGLVIGGSSLGTPQNMVFRYRNEPLSKDGYAVNVEATFPDGLKSAGSSSAASKLQTYGGTDKYGDINTIFEFDPATQQVKGMASFPHNLKNMAVCELGGLVYIFGGYSSTYTPPISFRSEIYVYNPSTGGLANTGYSLPTGLERLSATTDGTDIYIVGGDDSAGSPVNTVYTFNPSLGIIDTDTMAITVYDAAVDYYNNWIYIFGGYVNSVISSGIYMHSLVNSSTVLWDNLPIKIAGHYGGFFEGSLALFMGGVKGATGTQLNDRMIIYDRADKHTYYASFHLPNAGRFIGSMGSPYILGGGTGYFDQRISFIEMGDNLNVFERLTAEATNLPNLLRGHAAAYDGEKVYLVHGKEGDPGVYTDKIQVYDKATKTFSGSPLTSGYPVAHSGAAYDPDLDRVWIIGGSDGGSFNEIIYIDVASQNIYSAPATLMYPTHDMGCHYWNGKLFAVGGLTGATYRNEVFSYIPGGGATSTFMTLPKQLAGFGSVLIGGNIFVFGGAGQSNIPQDAIYKLDLVSKNWTRMESVLPEPMRNVCAVYDSDNDLVYLFGGDGSGGNSDDVFIYDPRDDNLVRADSSLPEPTTEIAGVYDATLLFGGVLPSGVSSGGVFSFSYIPHAPTGSDYSDGDDSGIIILNSQYPHVYDYDMVQVSSSTSVLNWQVNVNEQYYFEAEVGHAAGYAAIDQVDIYAWFDNGADPGAYDEATGGTRNFHLRYQNSTATGNLPVGTLLFPDSEISGFSVTEQNTGDSQRKLLRFYFTPGKFVRWADGCAGGSNAVDFGMPWSTAMALNDVDTWNFEIRAYDANANTNSSYDEFGVFKYQEMTAVAQDPSLTAAPGSPLTQMQTSDPTDRTYVYTAINAPFKLSVNVTDLNGPDTVTADNMYLEGGSLPGITQFLGAGEPNKLFYKGDAGTYVVVTDQPAGGSYMTSLGWYMTVPAGISEGIYTGYITYRMETSASPSQAASAANMPPIISGSPSPMDGGTVSEGDVSLSVGISDPYIFEPIDGINSGGSAGKETTGVDIWFMDDEENSLIAYLGNVTGGNATTLWRNVTEGYHYWYVVISDGEYMTVSDTFVFYAETANQAPFAEAGTNQTVFSPTSVNLDGTGSYDLDGWIPTGGYSWDFYYDGIWRNLVGPTVSWTFGIPGSYQVTLTVTDNNGATDTDTMWVFAIW